MGVEVARVAVRLPCSIGPPPGVKISMLAAVQACAAASMDSGCSSQHGLLHSPVQQPAWVCLWGDGMGWLFIGLGLCWGLSASGRGVAAAQLVCRRRSRQQLGAGADEPHTNRKIVRRPFSRCRTRWPTLKITYSSSPRAGGCGWLCCPACLLTSPTSASMSSELGLARWTVMELFMADKHLHLPAATMLHVLDQPRLRHLCAALGRCPVSS